MFRVDGKLVRSYHPPFSKEECQKLLFAMLSNDQRRVLEQNWELDFAYGVSGIGRFRINIYKERGKWASAIRSIKTEPPSLDDLGMPPVIKSLCHKSKGLILVTGPTGSGKSTTLASMIDYVNTEFAHHVLTIEDPVEFVHRSKRSVVHQREVGNDSKSFSNALKASLREDPDVILLGELRDLETIALAITAAETGHLVMGTLHTSSAAQSIDRIVDAFPAEQQAQVRTQLSGSLAAIVSQVLLPSINEAGDYVGRVMAQEIMVANSAISHMIREGKTPQMYSSIQTGASLGMTTMENSLYQLICDGKVKTEDALVKSQKPEELKRLLGDKDA